MGTLVSTMIHGVTATVAAAPGPRRAQSRRWDIMARIGRPLVAGRSGDHGPTVRAPAGVPVLVHPAQPARPFAIYTVPRRRLGTVPKLAPGKQGTGLGQPVMAGFVSAAYPGFTPMDYGPSTQPDNGIRVPEITPGSWQNGKMVLAPSYNAHDFAPARRFFMQNRSVGLWAQASYPPQIRPLTPSQQAPMLRRPALFARRQIPAGQPNPSLYTIGYPTAVGVAARLGGGPIAVLGGNSQ